MMLGMGARRVGALLGLSALALLPGLGSACRLTYHEAFVAQGAREMLAAGDWGHPTIGGRPWLEKPPLPWWLAVGLGRLAGGVDETIARWPSAAAAMLLALGVAALAARRFGPTIGWTAGALQATTFWTFRRGRLAEPDVLLAAIIAWAIVAFDRLSAGPRQDGGDHQDPPNDAAPGLSAAERFSRWAFFALLGASAWAKGVGFGAAQILAVVAVVLLWRRDGATARRLVFFAPGWALAAVLALAWPLFMIERHGAGALALWTRHVTERFAARPVEFAGEPWREYLPGLVFQALPWAPLALLGAVSSLRRALRLGAGPQPISGPRDGGVSPRPTGLRLGEGPSASIADADRLLWAWSAAPLGLLALATVRNAHYAIAAQAPWSIWAALALARLVERRAARLGRSPMAIARRLPWGLAALALAIGLGHWAIGPRVGPRRLEWEFYRAAGRLVPGGAPLTFLYDDWDRKPYFTPFGAFPHDLAVRLFYLGRPAAWRWDPASATAPADAPTLEPGAAPEMYVIGRERDRPLLEKIGRAEPLARGPRTRWDRDYVLFRVARAGAPDQVASRP